MTLSSAFPAHATSDDADRFVRADEAVAQLQQDCGGDMPGTVAMPELLETIRKSRRFQLKLARAVTIHSGENALTAWVEVAPRDDGEIGCDVVFQHVQPAAHVITDHRPLAEQQKLDIDRDLAELTAHLDSVQNVLSVEVEAADLADLAERMRGELGQRWTQFVSLEGQWLGQAEGKALHWRLLDGTMLKVPGSERTWRATLIPQMVPGQEPTGFQLCLNSDEPFAEPAPEAATSTQAGGSNVGPRLVGREVAPVLRQPIARIIANAETIRAKLAGPLAEEYSNYAADIAAAGQHLLALLDDLSDLEVVEAEEFVTAPDHTDLADVARRAAGILGVRARERGIIIEAPRAGESLPVIAEFRRVLQILLNLISNAIRYSPANSQIWIRLEEVGRQGQVSVIDQGPGLSEDQQAQLFNKFERLGRSGDGGSGLGLYISRRLAHAMKGELSVESAPGQGARFVLELPKS